MHFKYTWMIKSSHSFYLINQIFHSSFIIANHTQRYGLYGIFILIFITFNFIYSAFRFTYQFCDYFIAVPNICRKSLRSKKIKPKFKTIFINKIYIHLFFSTCETNAIIHGLFSSIIKTK